MAALEEWTQRAVPMMTALKAGDNVGATKQLIALVTGDPVENFELPPGLRQGLLDNARTLPLLFAAPQPTITCDALRAGARFRHWSFKANARRGVSPPPMRRQQVHCRQ